MKIGIVSDVVCPWCIVGYKQLEQALEQTQVSGEIHWHPFELNPNMPPEGQNLQEHIAEKYGSTKAQSEENRERLATLGSSLGLSIRRINCLLPPSPHTKIPTTKILLQ